MNPFSEIIESTRKESNGHHVQSRFQLKADTFDYYDQHHRNDTRPLPPIPHGEEKGDEPKQSTEDEVYAMLFRLKQILGEIDTAPIVAKLEQVKAKEQQEIKQRTEPKIVPNTSFKLLNAKANGKEKTAHFALTSPVIMNKHELEKQWSREEETDGDVESGESTSRSTRLSRYSLGSNRFSVHARQLSLGTLSYVGGNKLLRSNSRQSTSPDPYAYMSPSKPGKPSILSAGSMDAHSDSASARNSSVQAPPCTAPQGEANFLEFCVIGVQADMISGIKSLENSTLQPTEVLHMYPLDPEKEAVVSNLHEYCFPYGAELKYVTRRELDLLSTPIFNNKQQRAAAGCAGAGSVHGLQYQIMQFTDAAGVVYYAVCVLSKEPVEQVGPELQRNMTTLQNSIAAANTIKRYLAHFAYKRKKVQEAALNAKWIENMRTLRTKSSSTRSVATTGDAKSSKSNQSIFKALKRTMGVSFKPMKEALPIPSMNWLGLTERTVSDDKGSDTASNPGSSPAVPVNTKRLAMTHKNAVTPPLMGSPAITRQRSRSFASPARSELLSSSLDDGDAVSSFGGTSSILSGSAAEVGVDGSPCRSRALLEKLEQSNRKVALVTQRAYCIISDKPLHALFFQLLEAIALKERERAMSRWSCITQRNSSPSSSSPVIKAGGAQRGVPFQGLQRENSINNPLSSSAHVARRNAFLFALQYFDFPPSARNCDNWTKKATQVAVSSRQSMKHFEIAGQEYLHSVRINTRCLSLREWTVALLVCLIPSELVVKIHSLLLQELSLLVYGTDAGMVTAIATAFSLLLKPFSWEGIFVPLLPIAAYEALDAPVPFIVGVVSSCRPTVQTSSSAGILCLDDFINHPELYVPSCFDETTLRHTLASHLDGHAHLTGHSIAPVSSSAGAGVNRPLKFFESPCPEESKQGHAPVLDPMQSSQLKELHQYVAYHAVKIKASLRALHAQRVAAYCATAAIKSVMYDLSAEALRSLNHILTRVHEYNCSLCGEVLTQPGGWKQFGVLNSRNNQFEFLPDLFLEPLKANLRLQESVIHTQLFVSFMDEQSEAYLKLQPQRVFISDWLYYRMKRRKKARRATGRRRFYS